MVNVELDHTYLPTAVTLLILRRNTAMSNLIPVTSRQRIPATLLAVAGDPGRRALHLSLLRQVALNSLMAAASCRRRDITLLAVAIILQSRVPRLTLRRGIALGTDK